MDKSINDYLKFDDSLPFLFIGSGFSRRYLNTPDWTGLLSHFCAEIDPNNPLLLSQYNSKAKTKIYNENLNTTSINVLNSIIADYIEQDYNKIWYTDSRFEQDRIKYEKDVLKGYSPFRLALSTFFISAMNNQPHLLQKELDKLVALSHNSIAGIITTNYDTLLESLFNFTPYIGQEKLLFSSIQGISEIYKIHGCVTEPNSIIINSADYNKLNTKSKYLAAKLLTIFVEHPIIFIGYSLSDEDIKAILDNIALCLNIEQLDFLKSRFIFIDMLSEEFPNEYIISSIYYHTASNKDIPMTKIQIKDYGKIYDALSRNHTKYPVKWLRLLKESVYELVETTTPTNKIKIMLPFENMNNFENVEFVIGVGISKLAESAYSSFSAEDIYNDIVFDNKKFDPDLLLEKTMYNHLSRTCGSMPLFKYISNAQKEIPDRIKRYIKPNYESFYNASIRKYRTTSNGTSIEEICDTFSYPQNLYHIVRLPYQNLNKNALGNYLQKTLTDTPDVIYTGKDHPHSSDLRRLIKIYDWMCYSKQYQNKVASM